MAIISPSLLSSDFTRLADSVKMLERAGADKIHMDVMDGIFVPNITFGFPVIESISRITDIPLDVHMMVVDASRYIDRLRNCGAESMAVHVEACTHLHRTIEQIKQAGMKAGVTLNPATPLSSIEEVINDVDFVLLMSVDPGFSGQSYIPSITDKVRRLKEMICCSGSKALIEVDGGINLLTGREVIAAGADILVAGNFIFKSENPESTIRELRQL